MPPYVEPANTNLKTGLKRITANKDGTAVHFLIVRVAGPKSPARALFAQKASQTLPEAFRTAYKSDTEVKASKPADWFTIRGVAVREGELWVVYPATTANKVTDASAMKHHFRELRVALNARGYPGAQIDPLIRASIAKPKDISALVDKVPKDDEEEGDEGVPANVLALEVPEEAAIQAVRELAARFGRVGLTTASGLRKAAGVDVDKRGLAEKALLLVHTELREIQAAAQKQLRGLPVDKRAGSTNALQELIARCAVAVTWIEADLTELAPPNAEVAEFNGLKTAVKCPEYKRAEEWVTDAADWLKQEDEYARAYARPGALEKLGGLLQSGNGSYQARGEKQMEEMRSLANKLAKLARCAGDETVRAIKKYPKAMDTTLKRLVQVTMAAGKRLEALMAAAHAAALHAQAEELTAGPKLTAVRQKLTAQLEKNPGILQQLVKLPDGPKQLDRMVRAIGTKASTEDEKAFVKAAVEARFSCTLTGEHTTKALPRLYKVLGMVPEAHTTTNEKLITINRTKTGVEQSSGSYKAGLLEVSVKRTGWGTVEKELGQRGRKGKVSAFDHLTLHELGHAVDDDRKFMNDRRNLGKYAGWREESAESVATVIDTTLKFADAADMATLSEENRRLFLARVLKSDENGAKNLVDALDGAWGRLERHAAVLRCRAVRLNSGKGLWTKGSAGAHEAALGARVYVQAYQDTWCSYELKAWTDAVRDYQFRAKGEWFAEIYAAYYLDKLNATGDVYKWFQAEVDV